MIADVKGKMFQLTFFKFRLVKHSILTLKENTIKSYINYALQKVPSKMGEHTIGIYRYIDFPLEG
jgi:hypothetical protein